MGLSESWDYKGSGAEIREVWFIRWVLSGCPGRDQGEADLELMSKAGTRVKGKANRI